MTAVVRPKHRRDAEPLVRARWDDYLGKREHLEAIAQALADAEEYGVRKALHRLGPCIADAEIARSELAAEVDL